MSGEPEFSISVILIPLLFIALVAGVIALTARVARRAGFSGWWGLIVLLPPVYVVMIWMFAFVDWPALRQDPEPPANP